MLPHIKFSECSLTSSPHTSRHSIKTCVQLQMDHLIVNSVLVDTLLLLAPSYADSVVLDPNTASPWLHLSPDLTTVAPSPELLTLPDNPERFDPCVFLLGAEGYTSGKHRWDFKVGGNTTWIVGVCKESVVRKQKFTISTKRGVWCIGLSKGVYTVYTPERTELQVQHSPKSIRIKLNMDKGEVSFWDAETATHLVTLKHDFDEKMFPFFGPGLQSTPMILSEGKVSVHAS